MNRTHTKGFSVIEIGLVITVVAIIGGLGFAFYNKWSANQSTTAKTTTAPLQTAAVAPTISKTSDLSAASATLDATDVTSASDTNALNSDLSF